LTGRQQGATRDVNGRLSRGRARSADLIGCAARIGEQSAAPIGVIGALVGDALGLIDVGVGVVRYRAGIGDRAEQAMAGRVAEF
jgi:hypothetical protein